ncbi:hypothetical protein DFH07DRAFT_360989 [Mycena maculata]|uniref:Uncharacterized protein n=1 Tax=Mycena maculata TaxID=230809 RepID=A0AAD7MFU4_9AGAR|nr:hypothetical protein DFH07DRAFT_360989 [Mycena maculata]
MSVPARLAGGGRVQKTIPAQWVYTSAPSLRAHDPVPPQHTPHAHPRLSTTGFAPSTLCASSHCPAPPCPRSHVSLRRIRYLAACRSRVPDGDEMALERAGRGCGYWRRSIGGFGLWQIVRLRSRRWEGGRDRCGGRCGGGGERRSREASRRTYHAGREGGEANGLGEIDDRELIWSRVPGEDSPGRRTRLMTGNLTRTPARVLSTSSDLARGSRRVRQRRRRLVRPKFLCCSQRTTLIVPSPLKADI